MFSISQLIIIPAALLLLRFLFSLSLTGFPVRGVSWTNDPTKWHHTLARLQDEQMYNVALTRDKDYDDFNKTLDNILIMRVPGTEGHEKVRNYISSSMKALGWEVEEDTFQDRTPHGKKPFSNIIATLNPNACRRLTIACHYDSLNNREYTFLGATDSAVPCAMMINAARILHNPLKIQKEKATYDSINEEEILETLDEIGIPKKMISLVNKTIILKKEQAPYDSINGEEMLETLAEIGIPKNMISLVNKTITLKKSQDNDLTLQLIFFDGEEAFQRWSKTDSLYGSRHLAAKWNRMRPFPDPLYGSQCKSKDYASYLDRMDVMVLLDLIGTANPTFYSYFPDTYGLYSQIVDIEKRLNSGGLVEAQVPERNTRYFDSRSTLAFVEDDHIPFMKRGVPILHLIPSPFPHVWHKENDNRDSLHHPTIDNLNKILRVFIAEYLHLGVKSSDVLM